MITPEVMKRKEHANNEQDTTGYISIPSSSYKHRRSTQNCSFDGQCSQEPNGVPSKHVVYPNLRPAKSTRIKIGKINEINLLVNTGNYGSPKEKQIRDSQAQEKDCGRNLPDSWAKQHRYVEEIPDGTRDDKAYWNRAPYPRRYVAF
ncbi:hypothetical protein DPMN_145432 [Dreissena polymorpha]|uniref:Uncharacterized protein n=1 Tax=Dreissena polymorpha TaxID=45954 RepID=A0A9D4F9V9_DREPO|nr:hypothetical protein DPMN_145432 [Dreissena polymorpha]